MPDYEIHELRVGHHAKIAEEEPLREVKQVPPAGERKARPVRSNDVAGGQRDDPGGERCQDQHPVVPHENQHDQADSEQEQPAGNHPPGENVEAHVPLVVHKPDIGE